MASIKHLAGALAAVAVFCATTGAAQAHPHVFADARMEIVGDGQGKFTAVRNVWRMDELFSTSVVLDYDKNKNSILDDDELQAVADTVKESIAEYSFYTFVQKADGTAVKLNPPEDIRALYQDNQLIIFFEMKPAEPVDLKMTPISLAVFDETFFTAFEYADDGFQLIDMPATCTKEVTVPDEDEAAQQWMASIASLPADESVPEDGMKYAQILATRVSVKCG